VQPKAKTPNHLLDDIQEMPPVAVVPEDRFAFVAARGHMMPNRLLDSQSFEGYSDRVLGDDQLSRLLTFPNVLITSHQGFLTHEGLSEIARVTTENILRFDLGQPWLEGTLLT
jgi:lactate dehydrogenase-like 2-hydroxyacid dehydrogenase